MEEWKISREGTRRQKRDLGGENERGTGKRGGGATGDG